MPGGGIEEFENSQDAALREVLEEAGIKAISKGLIGEFTVIFTYIIISGQETNNNYTCEIYIKIKAMCIPTKVIHAFR